MVSSLTNSSDFRRYSYTTDASYALKAFDVQRTAAAPSYMPQRQRRRELRVHENPRKKSLQELKLEGRAARLQALKIMGVTLACVAMLAVLLCSYVQKNELNHEIASIENQIDIANSESTRLNSQLDAMVSVQMIDQYAVEKLGMSKMQTSQVHYVDVAQYKEARMNALANPQSPAEFAQVVSE